MKRWFPLAHYAQGCLRMVRGDPAGALSSSERVLARNPGDAWAHVRVAAALVAFGRGSPAETAQATAETGQERR